MDEKAIAAVVVALAMTPILALLVHFLIKWSMIWTN
jgi:hypothetical protein